MQGNVYLFIMFEINHVICSEYLIRFVNKYIPYHQLKSYCIDG